VIATADQATMINAGLGSVEVNVVDEVAERQLQITIELTAGGLVRARANVINIGEDAYTVNDCVIAFPIPQNAREVLDFAGHWGKERVAQRRPLTAGVHLREGRNGRSGADAATCCTLESMDSSSRKAKSGPCAPRGAETTPTTRSGSSPAPK
jgi:alpha-galactosidase